MKFYAHKIDDRKQTVKSHLIGTAELAKTFAVDIMKDIAYETGMAHDIGKYAQAFQDKLLNESKVSYEHSVCGAIELGKFDLNDVQKNFLHMMQYCIAGHHTGLPDGGTKNDISEDITLQSRLKRENRYYGQSDYSDYKDEIELHFPNVEKIFSELLSTGNMTDMIEKYAFFTRYLFSCLTDADFLDTERFCDPDIDRKINADFAAVDSAVTEKISSFIHDTELRKARKRLQDQAYLNNVNTDNISILNMPAGSGKTLCSLKIALDKLIKSGKKRIIYVIPYTSIIDQTASVFSDIFGRYMDILQHHSNYCFDENEKDKHIKEKEDDTSEKLKKSTENWDAPLIITTSVQFFQSLYHYKSSGLRKLHNLADSVIIFDEVHMLPVEMLQPCIKGIGHITKYLNSDAIFLSATMPDYSQLFRRYIPDCSFTELITDKSDFRFFQKCRYENLGETDYDNIIEKSMKYKSNLIIVNKRKTAREIYKKLTGNKFHLSTYMTPKDRSETIEKIKSFLKNNQLVTVVSTSLIEAGVDLDFETVFRELSGLDSILQSGGRCNREGFRECGNVFIFDAGDTLKGDMAVRASIVKSMLRNDIDISSEEAVKEYYQRLFVFMEDAIERNTIARDVHRFNGIPFRTYAKNFEFIRSETISVVINNCDETEKLLSEIKYGQINKKRELQKYSVSLKIHGEFDNALSMGLVSDVTGMGVFVLADNAYYSYDTGLNLDMSNDQIF